MGGQILASFGTFNFANFGSDLAVADILPLVDKTMMVGRSGPDWAQAYPGWNTDAEQNGDRHKTGFWATRHVGVYFYWHAEFRQMLDQFILATWAWTPYTTTESRQKKKLTLNKCQWLEKVCLKDSPEALIMIAQGHILNTRPIQAGESTTMDKTRLGHQTV